MRGGPSRVEGGRKSGRSQDREGGREGGREGTRGRYMRYRAHERRIQRNGCVGGCVRAWLTRRGQRPRSVDLPRQSGYRTMAAATTVTALSPLVDWQSADGPVASSRSAPKRKRGATHMVNRSGSVAPPPAARVGRVLALGPWLTVAGKKCEFRAKKREDVCPNKSLHFYPSPPLETFLRCTACVRLCGRPKVKTIRRDRSSLLRGWSRRFAASVCRGATECLATHHIAPAPHQWLSP